MNRYRIRGIYYIDSRYDSLMGPADIYIDRTISFTGDKGDYKDIDGRGMVLMPGFIQLHVHLCQHLYKGMAEDMPLFDWLEKHILPYEMNLTRNHLAVSARSALFEMISSGTTAFLDMGTFDNQDVLFEEIERSGITGFTGNVLMDRKIGDFYNDLNDYSKYSGDMAAMSRDYNHAEYVLCPRFLPGITREGADEIRKLSEEYNLIIHTHASETAREVEFSRELYGMGNIEAMQEMGVLGPNTVIAHVIHITEKEQEILRDTHTNIVHCPSANMKLGSGIAEIDKMTGMGINTGLGSDGAPCNNNNSQIMEMRLAGLLQKVRYGPYKMNARKIFKMATVNGAKALGLESVGLIEEGYGADVLMMDMTGLHLSDMRANPFASIIYSSYPGDIKWVFAKGIPLKSNGSITVYNENDILAERQRALKDLFPDRF
ncbi:MAG: amidohydrolase [candidate division WOR-3 bacterium]|nr:amidohydrolase [candidate division WOR-3 bacterium]